jgi:hypothetical protein
MPADEVFRDLEKTIPELLAELRRVITATQSMREIVVLPTASTRDTWPGQHVTYSLDVAPNLPNQLLILEAHGLSRQLRPGFAYRLSEPLVKYLKRISTGDD